MASVRNNNSSIFPQVHYIWIGPPPKETGGEPGHDIIGPLKMANCNSTNPILFWCLENYETFYKKRFQNYSNINVSTIENYLEQLTGDHKDKAVIARNIIAKHLEPQRNTVRDKVSVKNIFSLFLLLSKGGYVLDTNVMPSLNSIVSLPFLSGLYVPKFRDDWIGFITDYWLMYSPQAHSVNRIMFESYVERWDIAQAIFNQENYTKRYHQYLADIIPRIIDNVVSDYVNHWVPYYINMAASKNTCTIESLKLDKYYYNTHKFERRCEHDRGALYTQKVYHVTGVLFPPKASTILASYLPEILEPSEKKDTLYTQIYFDICNDNLDGIQFQIDEGVDINRQINSDIAQGETPLHCAIKYNKPKAVALLLEHNADPNLVVTYANQSAMNAFELAKSCQNACQEIITKHVVKSVTSNKH